MGSTHEEVITDLVRRRVGSYKDLPFSLYQIQNKFRNEIRATGGLLRVREFIMKDLYSFHANEKDLAVYFKKVIKAYHKIFKRCGLRAVACQASGGSIGGSETYEFHILSAVGEDKVHVCEKCSWAANAEEIKDKDECPQCQSKLIVSEAIEAGHVFSLGCKYSKAMKAEFVDKDGKKKAIHMGCYGIGLGRLMATIVEALHDEKGIIWPVSVAPYQAHLIVLDGGYQFGDEVHNQLVKAGVEVLYDDRENVSAGAKFADADLIGIPVRLVVSEKTAKKKEIEFKKRDKEKTEQLDLQKVIDSLLPE